MKSKTASDIVFGVLLLVVYWLMYWKGNFFFYALNTTKNFAMPKTSDGIDNILIYFENEAQSYRAGNDMVGKVGIIFNSIH